MSEPPPAPVAHPRRTRRARTGWRAVPIVLLALLWLAIGGFGGIRQGELSTVQDNDPASFLPQDAESTRAGTIAAQFDEQSTLPALVVVTREDGTDLSADDLASLRTLAERVYDLDLPDGRVVGDVLTSPLVPVIPAEDGRAALLPVPVDGEQANDYIGADEQRVVNVVVTDLRELLAADLPAGLQSWVTGPAGGVADLVEAFGGIDGLLLVVALAVVLVILIAVYRSPSLPFAVLLTSVFGLCLAALVVYPLADAGILALNGQAQGILSILVVGAATDYSLLLVARFREALTVHESPWDAMKVAVRGVIEPILASAGTVIVGLLCLLLSDLASNASLGPVAAIGIVSAVLAALTLLPVLLLIGGPKARFIFWPRMPRVGDAASDDGHRALRGGVWARVADFVARRDRAVWIGSALLLAALAAFLPTFRAEGTAQSEIFLADVESVAGEEVLARHFDAGNVQPAEVVTTPERLDAVVAAAQGVDGVDVVSVVREAVEGAPGGMPPGVGGTEGGPPPGVDVTEGGPPPGVDVTEGGPPPGVTGGDPAQGPAEVPATEAPVREVDGRVLVHVATIASAESTEGVDTVREVRDAVHAADPDALVGGAAAQTIDTQSVARQDLVTIIPIVLVAIFLMLVVLLRSVVGSALLMIANVLSFGAAMGLAAIVFNHVLGFPGADATVPLYGFVFLVALGIDYSIFLMTRVREEALRHGTREGVRRGLAVTGGVITSAGLVLAATFGALAVIPLLFLVQLAFIVAVGVLIDTFIVRSLLVAGLVHNVGDAVWWPAAKRMREATRRAELGDEDDVPVRRGRHAADVPAR